ncbi:MAG: hypothetical protein EOP45_11040 [Sphingobacteriaceae bacterium]|nr:MAG: hypothetical protein EOP45_11040 [Sphingobacteriaceae bacterium]
MSHGATSFLLDRLMKNSDEYSLHLCQDCGMIATGSIHGEQKCLACQRLYNTKPVIVKTAIPYAAKLLFQELTSMGIAPRCTF